MKAMSRKYVIPNKDKKQQPRPKEFGAKRGKRRMKTLFEVCKQ